MKVRELIRDDFKKAFEKVDILLTPTSPTTAFKLGAHDEDPLALYLADLYTCQGNIGGLAGISVPFGYRRTVLRADFAGRKNFKRGI